MGWDSIVSQFLADTDSGEFYLSDKPKNWDKNKAYIEKIKKQIKQDKDALKQETKEK